MPDNIDVSIVLPAHNEEQAIGEVIDEIFAAMKNYDGGYEILIVDDASSDQTANIALKRGVRVIKHPEQGGSGAARRTGILRARGKYIVMLDADGTYDPSYIPEMLSYFPQYDQVNGARTSEEGTMPLIRKPVKKILGWFASWVANRNIPDINTGLKAFKRDIMLPYLWVMPNGFSCVTSMTLAFLCNSHPVKYIPVQYRRRIGKSKFHPVTDTWRFGAVILRMGLYFNPLRPASFLFAGLMGWGVIKSLLDWFIVGRLQLSDVVIIFTAITVLVLGLLADLMVSTQKASAWRNWGDNLDPLEIDFHGNSPESQEHD